MKKFLVFIFSSIYLIPSSLLVAQTTSRWELNRMDTLAGKKTSLLGSPQLFETVNGKSVSFNGTSDGILVDANPVANANEFTIEVIFKPDSGSSVEPRFIHIEQDANNRITVELRLTNAFWYLDTYIKSGNSEKTLLSTGILHPVGQWYHVALVYKNGVMTDYINGIQELSGAVTFATQTTGKTSIGVRQNLKYWYKGAIKTVKTTPLAISSNQFINSEIIPLNAALGIDPELEAKNSITAFPIPATDQVRFLLRNLKSESIKWTMSNALGHEVLGGKWHSLYSGDNIQLIERNNLPSGLYFVHFAQNAGMLTLPILFTDK